MKTLNRKRVAAGAVILIIATSADAIAFQSVKTMYYETQRFLSGLKVTVKQTAMSLHQRSETTRKSRSIKSVAEQAVQQTAEVKAVMVNFSPEFGQPVTAKCLAIAEKTAVKNTVQTADEIKTSIMNGFANTTTDTVESDTRNKREAHNEMFCNTDEAKAGACKFVNNGLQGWDSNYGNYVSNSTFSAPEVTGALAYINTMAEAPPPEVVNCKSAACLEARAMYLTSAAQSSAVTKVLLGQVTNRMNKQSREVFKEEI